MRLIRLGFLFASLAAIYSFILYVGMDPSSAHGQGPAKDKPKADKVDAVKEKEDLKKDEAAKKDKDDAKKDDAKKDADVKKDKAVKDKEEPKKEADPKKEKEAKDKPAARDKEVRDTPKDKPVAKDKAPEPEVKEPDPVPPEEQLLKSAKLPTDGPALLEVFRKRSQLKVDREMLTALAKQLGETNTEKRDKAFGELVSYGAHSVPVLRLVANDMDNPEAAAQARLVLQTIEGSSGAALTIAASRRVSTTKPAGAADALIEYLPYAEDETVIEDVTNALKEVATLNGKPEPGLLKALADPIPGRRAAAAEVLAQVGGVDLRPTVRKLLKDPKPSVRLRTALALSQFQDLEAIPSLINLLGDLPQEQTRPAEEYLARLAGEWAVTTPPGDDAISRQVRRDAWAAWWKNTEGPNLIKEFNKRTLGDEDREKGLALIALLNDPKSTARDQALTDLMALGSGAVPLLRQVLNTTEGKTKERIQKCLELVQRGAEPSLPPVAARLLALRKPEGAAEALLAYLPLAEDDTMSEEVLRALGSVVLLGNGKIDPAVTKALRDKNNLRRAAAAEAICQAADQEQRQEARKLLQDPDLTVRLRVARAFLAAKEKDAIPVLIALITDIPKEQADQVFEYLYQVADDKAPPEAFADEAAARKKCQDAWTGWWKNYGAKVDLAKLNGAQRLLGYTLIVEGQDNHGRGLGRIVEIDTHGKVRWEIKDLQFPIDAQVISSSRVIVAEHNGGRVSERDLKGKIIWQKSINQPLSVQHLTNGHTFIAGRNSLVEVDRDGKDVFSHNRPNGDIMVGRRMTNGNITFMTQQGQVIRMDSKGKELKTSQATQIQWWLGGHEILANEHLLMPLYQNHKVVEYDGNGKVVWEGAGGPQWPNCCHRLPNGNTLVGSQQTTKVVELDRNGKVVWEPKETYRPHMIRRR